MTRRAIAKPNQSYLDANQGRVILVEDDVLGIKRRIEQQWPDLEVVYDHHDNEWLVIQTWTDAQGNVNQSLALKADTLDERLIARCHEADPTSRHYVDPVEHIDKHNAEIEREQERQFEDKIGDFGERFIHALRQDGVHNHDNIEGPRSPKRKLLSNRAINRDTSGAKKRTQ